MNNVVQLTAQETYNTWVSTMTAIFRTLKLSEVVIQGLKPFPGSADNEIKAYHSLNDSALYIFIQVLSPNILKCIVDMDTPHDMWTHLKGEFQRNTAYALIHQLGSLCQLAWSFDHSMPISGFIQKFEAEWFQLFRLARDSTDSHRQEFAVFLGNDKAKRDFLLGMLSRHCKNIVDNLTTKDDLSFTDVKQRLLDCDNKSTNSALLTREIQTQSKGKGKFKKQRKNFKKIQKPLLECSFCRKHHSTLPKNHDWKKCSRLRDFNVKLPKANPPAAQAHMTVETYQVSNKIFFLDTCATSHMSPHLNRFIDLQICTDSVTTSSGGGMKVKGKGSVALNCVLGDGTISVYIIKNVLFIPELQFPLFSWRAERSNGLTLHDNGKTIIINN
ncbi:hypothetical protein K3495_g15612 [Podosphaera aphanis]|nr:hypothetical protein K3495_g15612 [Podosphaera aphanis]